MALVVAVALCLLVMERDRIMPARPEARARLAEADLGARNADQLTTGGFATETRRLTAQTVLLAATAAEICSTSPSVTRKSTMRSRPDPTANRKASAPAPPFKVSLPPSPHSVSLPAAPESLSVPALPCTWSWPAPAFQTSRPLVPSSRMFSGCGSRVPGAPPQLGQDQDAPA